MTNAKAPTTASGSGTGGEKTKFERAVQSGGFKGEVTRARTAPDQSRVAPRSRTNPDGSLTDEAKALRAAEQKTPARPGPKTPDEAATNYAKMHGSDGARAKAEQLRAKGGPKNAAMAEALDRAAGGNSKTAAPATYARPGTKAYKAQQISELESKLSALRDRPNKDRVDRTTIARFEEQLRTLKGGPSAPSGGKPTDAGSKHPGATMSDHEFAKLQLDWEAAKRKRNKIEASRLRNKINAELEARGSGQRVGVRRDRG